MKSLFQLFGSQPFPSIPLPYQEHPIHPSHARDSTVAKSLHPCPPFHFHWPSSGYYNFPTVPSENLSVSPLASPFSQFLSLPNHLLYHCSPLNFPKKNANHFISSPKASSSQILRRLKPKYLILKISDNITNVESLKKRGVQMNLFTKQN